MAQEAGVGDGSEDRLTHIPFLASSMTASGSRWVWPRKSRRSREREVSGGPGLLGPRESRLGKASRKLDFWTRPADPFVSSTKLRGGMVATLFQAAEKEERWFLEGVVPDGPFLLVDDLETVEHETEIGIDGNTPGLAGHRLGAEGG
ncbi:hypothetical protein LA080_004446 [Diaporthe eres]|nr:hypothetical protein LA080_004446 [Diaporthe eres]